MADALVVNDPITGQGSNNAAKCSKIYFDAILANDNQSFSEQWMVQTFERYWSYAEKVVAWTNSLLLPPEPHVVELLAAASKTRALLQLWPITLMTRALLLRGGLMQIKLRHS